MKKFLCVIGFHNWLPDGRGITCEWCGKKEWIEEKSELTLKKTYKEMEEWPDMHNKL